MCDAAHGTINKCCSFILEKRYIYIYIYTYNNNKTILIEIFTSSFVLSDDATQSVNNSVVFGNGNKKVTIQELLDTSSDESFVFTGGNKHKKIILDTQFDFDEQDFALAGNGIENIDTLVIPETKR